MLPFLDEIRKLRSLAVVGLAKNTGKTETLNYVLRGLSAEAECVAVTSIGVDGERTDRVTQTEKPEIFFFARYDIHNLRVSLLPSGADG